MSSDTDGAQISEAPPARRLDPKKSARIYALGGRLGLDRDKLVARVDQLENNAEADEAIAILQEELAKKDSEEATKQNEGR